MADSQPALLTSGDGLPIRVWCRVTVAVIAAVMVILAAAAGSAFADSPLAWSSPATIDVHEIAAPITAEACPTSSLCVTGDNTGGIAVSTNAASGSPKWTGAIVDPGLYLRSVSCPSTSLCVAVGSNRGDVLTSTDPAAGPSSWSVTTLPGSRGMSAVSCTAQFCIVASADSTGHGEILTSTNPAGGAGTWTGTSFSTVAYGLRTISCPSISLCVAVGGANGTLVTSTDPMGGAGAWTTTQVSGTLGVMGMSCPSTTLCVGVDNASNVITATDPAGGAGAWKVVPDADPSQYGFSAISCPSVSLCVAVDNVGHVITATDPTGPASAWSTADADTPLNLPNVSCAPATKLCLTGDNEGNVLASTNPTGGAPAWDVVANPDGLTAAQGGNAIDGASCIPGPLCVAVDDAGNVVTSTAPAADPGAWAVASIDGSTEITAVSCITGPLCVAVDGAGNVLASTDPDGGAGAWPATHLDANAFVSVSCVAGPFCVAEDQLGNTLTSTDPTGGAAAWTSVALGPNAFLSVSCASASLCVGIRPTSPATLITSSDPSGGAGSWIDAGEFGDPVESSEAISCPSVAVCVSADVDGHIVSTGDLSATSPSNWTIATLEPAPGYGQGKAWPFTSVSCASTFLCIATDTFGGIAMSSDPTGPPDAWTLVNAANGVGLTASACASPSLCVAFDRGGEVVVGQASPVTLQLSLAGTGSGAVSAGAVTCATSCSPLIPWGGSVTLIATPAPGSTFTGWSGACSGSDPCTLTPTTSAGVTATFAATPGGISPVPVPAPAPVPVPAPAPAPASIATVGIAIPGSGTVRSAAQTTPIAACPGSCAGTASGGSLVLYATPALGWTFEGWAGACSGSGPCDLSTSSDAGVSARFAPFVPQAPRIRSLEMAGGTVTVKLTLPRGATGLQCALVHEPTRPHAHRPRPIFVSCGTSKTYRGLRSGTYTLSLRALAPAARSTVASRRLTVP